MGFEPLTFYIAHVHIITVASLPTEPPRIYMPWSLFIAKSVQLFYLQCYFFFWMNLNEWITVLSCYTCFLLDSIHDGQYSYCVRSIHAFTWIFLDSLLLFVVISFCFSFLCSFLKRKFEPSASYPSAYWFWGRVHGEAEGQRTYITIFLLFFVSYMSW